MNPTSTLRTSLYLNADNTLVAFREVLLKHGEWAAEDCKLIPHGFRLPERIQHWLGPNVQIERLSVHANPEEVLRPISWTDTLTPELVRRSQEDVESDD